MLLTVDQILNFTELLLQDLSTSHGAEIWAKYVNRHTGRRSDAATGEFWWSNRLIVVSGALMSVLAYVHSVMDVQNNLHLRCDARGCRVLFDDNNKAIGVSYVPSRNRANGARVQETVVRCWVQIFY